MRISNVQTVVLGFLLIAFLALGPATSATFAERCGCASRARCCCPSCEPSHRDDGEVAPTPEDEAVIDEDLLLSEPRFAALANDNVVLPNMIGDTIYLTTGSSIYDSNDYELGSADFPVAGGSRRFKISENNSPIPVDRVFFTYHHFHNAVDVDTMGFSAAPTRLTSNIDRYTLGLEKTCHDGMMSIEARVPINSTFGYESSDFGLLQDNNLGNISLALKVLLLTGQNSVLAGGLGINLPTADDVTAQIGGMPYSIGNDAVHLLPYLGGAHVCSNGRLFTTGFAQLDVPTYGNDLMVDGVHVGRANDQTLLYLDWSVGYWIYRNESAPLIRGLAPVVELHYTTSLNDADNIMTQIGGNTVMVGNRLNRVDIVDLTCGFHINMGRADLRIGAVMPMNQGDERQFDAEIAVQLDIRR